MENYLEKFRKTEDPEEIREIFKKIKEEDLPLERVIPPRVVASKIMEIEQINTISEFLRLLDEEQYETYWDSYIHYEFFVRKIKESEDIGDIGTLLSELIGIGYPEFWIYEEFTVKEILQKVKESSEFQDVLRYYLGFLRGGHQELRAYLDRRITSEHITSLLKKAQDLCDVVLILYFSLQLGNMTPRLPFSKEKMKELIEDSPLRCLTEFLYLSGKSEKKWRALIIPHLKDLHIEDEDFSDLLDFFEEITEFYNYKKKEPKEVIEIFTPLVIKQLSDKDTDLALFTKGIVLLHKVFFGLDFLERLSLWERFNKRWPPYSIANLLVTIIDMGYPISKIPEEMLLHYLTYYNLFASFLFYMEEFFYKVKTHRDRYIAFIRDMVHLYGEDETLKELSNLHPERALPALGFLRSTVDILENLTLYPHAIKTFLEHFTQLSEIEEFSSMLTEEEKRMVLNFLEPKRVKDFILSSEGLTDVNMFISRFLNSQDRFSGTILRVLDELTREEMEMLLSSEDNPENIEAFLVIIDNIFSERKYTFGKKLPPHTVLEKLYNVSELDQLLDILFLLVDMGFDKNAITGEFLRGLFTRDDIPLYAEWGLFSSVLKEKGNSKYEDLLPEEEEEYFMEGRMHAPGYTFLFFPLLSFYKELRDVGIDNEWIKGFTLKEIQDTISVTRIEFITAFLELLYYGEYPKEKIYKIEPSLFLNIIKDETNGVTSLFMKKRLLDILSFWGYPMNWIKRLTLTDLIQFVSQQKDLKDLDIFLITLRRLGVSIDLIEEFLLSKEFYEKLKGLETEDMARAFKAFAVFDVPIPYELVELATEKSVKNMDSKRFDIFVQGFPIVKNLSYFDTSFFIEKIVEKRNREIILDEHLYKSFVRFITYTGKEEYDTVLKKYFLFSEPQFHDEEENDLFLGFFDEDSTN